MAYGIDTVDLVFEEMKEKFSKTVHNFSTELKSMRAGRANPHILDKITVDYYGVPTPINNMANITVPEARLLVISVWDKSALKKRRESHPRRQCRHHAQQRRQRHPPHFPRAHRGTQEKPSSRSSRAMRENTKIVLRNARRDAIDALKKLEKDSEITEDDLKDFTADVDKALSSEIEDVDKLTKDKEQEILSV